MVMLKNAYMHWWRHNREYWGIAICIAALNMGIGGMLFLLGKGCMGELKTDSLTYAVLVSGLLCALGARAAVKIRLVYRIRNRVEGLPEKGIRFLQVWVRYLYGQLIVALPVLIIPMVIWYEAPFCILLLRWRMHFLPYTGVLEPDRDIGRNGIRRGQGMVWPVCVTATGTKWAVDLVSGILVLSFWLAGSDGWVMATIAGWAISSMVVEPLYQTGNLLLYVRQYQAQTKSDTFWMDMEEGCEKIQEGG